MQLKPGALILEGLCNEFGANLRSLACCEIYRVRTIDFEVVISSVPDATYGPTGWYHRFRLLESETRKQLRHKLRIERGRLAGKLAHPHDEELRVWKERRCERLDHAHVLKMLRRNEGANSFDELSQPRSPAPEDGPAAAWISETDFPPHWPISTAFMMSGSRPFASPMRRSSSAPSVRPPPLGRSSPGGLSSPACGQKCSPARTASPGAPAPRPQSSPALRRRAEGHVATRTGTDSPLQTLQGFSTPGPVPRPRSSSSSFARSGAPNYKATVCDLDRIPHKRSHRKKKTKDT